MNLLIDSLDEAWRDRRDYYAGGNMFLYYSETQSKQREYRGPDVFVVLGTERRERKSWVVWEEEGRTPDVIVEITSDTTEHIDRGPKMRIYGSLLKVPFYALYDPFSAELDAYHLDSDSKTYERLDKDPRGYVRCEPLKLWLGVVPGVVPRFHFETPWLRWIDDDGRVLPDPSERAEHEAKRAEHEAKRAEHEAERAEHEAERAEHEAKRAEEEAKRAEAAAIEVARLRAELEQLKK